MDDLWLRNHNRLGTLLLLSFAIMQAYIQSCVTLASVSRAYRNAQRVSSYFKCSYVSPSYYLRIDPWGCLFLNQRFLKGHKMAKQPRSWTRGHWTAIIVAALLCVMLLIPLLLNFSAVRAALGQSDTVATLSGKLVHSSAGVNLSKQGTLDWAHWGLQNSNSFADKQGATQRISAFTHIGHVPVRRFK